MSLTKTDLKLLKLIINEAINESVDKAVAKAVDKAVAKAIDKAVDKAVNNAVYNQILALVPPMIDKKFEELNRKIDFLPTKEEYYKTMDKLLGEIKEYRNERIFLSNRVTRVEDDVDMLKTAVFS